jgi:NAD(P)-dependent dehydrogenase (short-subunit alcohol dehydrogenase family)
VVAIHGRTDSPALSAAARELRRAGQDVTVVFGDLASEGEAQTIVDQAAEALGGLDILVNNAGIVVPMTADQIDRQNWQTVLDVNLTAAFFASQAAARHMRLDAWGRIINISSQAAEVAIPTYLPYGVSKAGLNIMTRYLAVEWSDAGITVNAVAPAFIGTDMAQQVFEANPDLYADQLERVPKRRMGTVDEVAAAVCYLASPGADFTTGEVLHVDGGYLAL